MTALLGFFTRPDAGLLWWSILLLLATMTLQLWASFWTRPPRLVASTTSAELGAESPAVASLLTNGFVVTPPAAVATLLDLVSRGWLRIEHTEHEVVILTDRRGREGDALKGYEQQVLNHIHKLTAGTLTGVSGAGVEIAGLRLLAPLVASVHPVSRRRRQAPAPHEATVAPARRRSSRRHARCSADSSGGVRCAAAIPMPSSTRSARERSPAWSAWPSSSSACAC